MGFVRFLMCNENIVQDVGTSCGKAYMSMQLWKYTIKVSMVKIPSQDEKDIRVGLLLLTDVLIEFTQCLTPVVGGARRDVYCCYCKKAVNSLGR